MNDTESEKIERITFFFPMYNEEKNAERTILIAQNVAHNMQKSGEIKDYEILVVDDCSTDGTQSILEKLKKEDNHIRVIRHERNRKLGEALKTGLYNAKGDVILYSDADLPFDLSEVSKALRLMKIYNADIVSAYRFDRTSEGPRRAIYSFVYNLIIRFLFGVRIRDVNFSFKLIRKKVLERIELKSEGSFIDAELIVRPSRSGFRVIQFGTDYFPRTRGISTLSSFNVILKIIKEMIKLYPELKRINKC